MNNTRGKLMQKIKEDTGFIINPNWVFYRPTLSIQHKTAGRMCWYFLTDNGCAVGSSENMSSLLNGDTIKVYKGRFGFIEFHSS